jgi:hypothetical protein
VGRRWDRFRELATREDRRGAWSALWIALFIVLAGGSSGLLTPAINGKQVDVALLVPGIILGVGVLCALYLATAPLLGLWPHHPPREVEPVPGRPTDVRPGSVIAGGDIRAGKDIRAAGDVTAGGSIRAGGPSASVPSSTMKNPVVAGLSTTPHNLPMTSVHDHPHC